MPANFRTYEGQLRLLTAVIAAHPGLKLDYKAIAAHYGSDWTTSGVEHFFRPIKKNSQAIQAMVGRGEDAMNFSHPIHKYFGESTPDGINFQFRSIKQEANAMRKANGPTSSTSAGGDGGGNTTPKTPRTAGNGTGRKRAAPGTGKSAGTSNKKAKGNGDKKTGADYTTTHITDDDSDDALIAPIDMTPSKIRFNAEKMKELEEGMSSAPAVGGGGGGATTGATFVAFHNDDDDDVKIVEPTTAALGSFPSQSAPAATASATQHSWDQPSFANNGDSYYNSDDIKQDFDEDAFGEC